MSTEMIFADEKQFMQVVEAPEEFSNILTYDDVPYNIRGTVKFGPSTGLYVVKVAHRDWEFPGFNAEYYDYQAEAVTAMYKALKRLRPLVMERQARPFEQLKARLRRVFQ